MKWDHILERGEGQLFVAGVLLWALLAAEVVAAWLADADVGRGMLFGIATEIFTGRESGVPVALSSGVPAPLVFQVSVTQDVASALLVFPLFLLLLHHFHDADNYVMRRIRKMERLAREHRAWAHRWGPLGIGVFMLVPFLINGPMLGMVVGRIAGLKHRYVLPAVVTATAIAAAAWVFFFERTFAFARRFGGGTDWLITGFVVVVVVGLATFDYMRERRQERRAKATRAE